jgi:sulfatase maturation enzyme AslB (radical SAM superfamily)
MTRRLWSKFNDPGQTTTMTHGADALKTDAPALDSAKFRDPRVTADGQRRAAVDFRRMETLWFNTGTLCNLACDHCYIESSPTNDRLVYLTAAEVAGYLDEAAGLGWQVPEIGITGGEPFMNPDIMAILEDALGRGHRVLVLTNAMKPMHHHRQALLDLRARFGVHLAIRVSVDHYSETLHELERGGGSWAPMVEGLAWLSAGGFNLSVAGRTCWQESVSQLRAGYRRLFATRGIQLDVDDQARLHLLPEMDADVDVPEITTECWNIVGADPAAMMCATSRMVVKRKGAAAAAVTPCTLLPYDEEFEMGESLGGALDAVALNHPHCARFCVLGGGSCTAPQMEDPAGQ